ncbi:MAG: hypothetical protein ACLR4Z_01440 [Butyricicoccaceae bacterium]
MKVKLKGPAACNYRQQALSAA